MSSKVGVIPFSSSPFYGGPNNAKGLKLTTFRVSLGWIIQFVGVTTLLFISVLLEGLFSFDCLTFSHATFPKWLPYSFTKCARSSTPLLEDTFTITGMQCFCKSSWRCSAAFFSALLCPSNATLMNSLSRLIRGSIRNLIT